MDHLPPLLQQLLLQFTPWLGSAPTAHSLFTLVLGWLLCHGRHTLSAVIRAAGPHAPQSHDAYQNFFSKAQWSMDPLWKMLFLLRVRVLVWGPREAQESAVPSLWLAGDDTLAKHGGRQIGGAGLDRDAVRSSKQHTAYAWGLQWVVLALIVRLPLIKDRFIALPIYARLNPKQEAKPSSTTPRRGKDKAKGRAGKKKKTTVTLMGEMIHTVAAWLPQGRFVFYGDGAYACLAGQMPENVVLISRMRCDAALDAPPPNRSRKPGRPAKKGRRLPSPQQMAGLVGRRWRPGQIDLYGKIEDRQLYAFTALWYEACPDRLVRIVIVRDPQGQAEDEYFFTTDLDLSPQQIVFCDTGRWAIEVTFRETKQYLGLEDPQVRKQKAVLRITPFCLWLNSVVKFWFVLESRTAQPELPENDSWYAHKDTISFQDMVGAIRLHFWRDYIFAGSTSQADTTKI